METKLAYMKIIMWAIIAPAILLYVGELRVGFKPFSITLNRWILALGWACVLFGVSLLQYEVAKELILRSATKHPECELRIADKFQQSANIDEVFSNLAIQDFTLDGYSSDEPLKVEMLAPKEL